MAYTKTQKREYQRLWYKRRREAYMAGKACKNCGKKKKRLLLWATKKKASRHQHALFTYSAERIKQTIKEYGYVVVCWPCYKRIVRAYVQKRVGVSLKRERVGHSGVLRRRRERLYAKARREREKELKQAQKEAAVREEAKRLGIL